MSQGPISYSLKTGPQIETPTGVSLQPISRVLAIRVGKWNGLVWNRPVAVLVTGVDGQQQTLPVLDRTRRLQVLILTTGLAASLLIAGIYKIRTER